jgi:hypothetical protein
METPNYINYADLHKFVNIKDPILLGIYLKEVFKDL